MLAANIHSFHYCAYPETPIRILPNFFLLVYQWSLQGTLKQSMKLPNAIWGTVALICFDMIVFFSTQYWRQKAYNLFLSTHIIGFIIVMPAVSLIIVEEGNPF